MKVLIIQDFEAIGRLETEHLRAAAHDVTWVTGFKDVEGLVAFLPDGTTTTLSTDFDLALVDGEIDSPSGKPAYIGPDVIERLTNAGVRCVANSSNVECNEEMKNRGAFRAVNQLVLFASLTVCGLVTLEDLIEPSEEAEKILAMDLRSFLLTGPGAAYREQLNSVLR